MGRLLAIVFGGACYAFAMAVICYAGNFLPKSIDVGGSSGRLAEAATIDRWRGRPGHPQPVKRGGRVYYLVSELDEFISKLVADR